MFYFYPRSPCGERQRYKRHPNRAEEFLSTLSLRRATSVTTSFQGGFAISIHALLAESDPRSGVPWQAVHRDFYPRSPCGERPTTTITICIASKFLSTLSLRRATAPRRGISASRHDFYPRSPCGERRIGLVFLWWGVRFLSTLSLRRAT